MTRSLSRLSLRCLSLSHLSFGHLLVLSAALALILGAPGDAYAGQSHKAHHSKTHRQSAALHTTARVSGPKQSAIILDVASRRVVYAEQPDALRYPASLTKMMTLYLTFDALDRGQLQLDQKLHVSAHAAGQAPSKIGLTPGSTITVEQAILAIVTKSANDAAAALGEALGSSETNFATMMTSRARSLGMHNTVYRNASGLPNPGQHTTARDMATLALALWTNHHKYYRYFSTTSFTYEGQTFPNHNHLLANYEGTDGIKTGYIGASGFNLVASVERNNRRLIGVVFGGSSVKGRDTHMERLLDTAFAGHITTDDMRLADAPPTPVAPKTPATPKTPKVVAAPTVVATAAPVAAATAKPTAKAPTKRLAAHKAPPKSTSVLTTVAAHLNPVPEAMAHDQVPENTRAARNQQRDEWAIQVGAFSRADRATRQAQRAIKAAPSLLDRPKVDIETPQISGDHLYRARLAGLSEREAHSACRQLQAKQLGCLVVMQ